MNPPKHPASEFRAALFHGGLAGYFALGIGLFALGLWFHNVSFWRHWKDRDKPPCPTCKT